VKVLFGVWGDEGIWLYIMMEVRVRARARGEEEGGGERRW